MTARQDNGLGEVPFHNLVRGAAAKVVDLRDRRADPANVTRSDTVRNTQDLWRICGGIHQDLPARWFCRR